jgi:hypothetical protein
MVRRFSRPAECGPGHRWGILRGLGRLRHLRQFSSSRCGGRRRDRPFATSSAALEREGRVVTHYQAVAQQLGSTGAIELAGQLTAWLDRMVTHQRVLATVAGRGCDDACPHVEAIEFWRAAVDSFGDAADRLAFLKRTAAAALSAERSGAAGSERDGGAGLEEAAGRGRPRRRSVGQLGFAERAER